MTETTQELTVAIGSYNADTRQVPVTFTSGDIVHTRNVNAVLNGAGKYDRKATAERVADVGRGVAAKIAVGVIVNMPPADEEVPADNEGTAPAAPAT